MGALRPGWKVSFRAERVRDWPPKILAHTSQKGRETGRPEEAEKQKGNGQTTT